MRKHFIQKIAILSLMLAMSQTMSVLCSEQLSEEISEDSMENKEDINQSQEEELTISEKELTDKNAQETNSQNEVNETGWGDNADSYSDENSGDIDEEDIPKPEVQNEEFDESDIIGWSQQGEDWYYFDAPGSKAYGWRLLGNVWYYFDKDNVEKPGIMLSSTRRVINGEVFFFGESGAMRKGWIEEPEGWYYAKENGAMATGWQWIGNAWYYLDGDNELYPGLMQRDCKQVIGNSTYFFQPSGAMITGWALRPEGWYFANTYGAMVTGWQQVGSTWYYLDGENSEYPGLMLADCKKVFGNITYFFEPSGKMATGWAVRPEGRYYTNLYGAMVTGWQQIGSTWYYLDGENSEYPGLMAADTKKVIGDATYFFKESGEMVTGWALRPEGWYYTNIYGAMITGWQQVGSSWFYLDRENEEYPGLMIADTKKVINGYTYYFNPNGSMKTGWLWEGNDWYYLNIYGQPASGWVYVGTDRYYLDPNNGNKMLSNGWHEIHGLKYYLYPGGAMAKNWLLLKDEWYNDEWYYLGSDGAMKTGWQLVNGRWYYMYKANDPNGGKEGVMAKNTVIDGYELADNGAMYNETEQAARSVLNSVGWNLRAAFNWSAGLTYYRMTADASAGSEWFANYGFQNKRGNCYVMAATFCYMARMLGYDAHQMAGVVPRIGGGVTPHSWCEIVINGTTYVFDPDFTYETGRNGYQITYGTSGTWVYSSYYRMN